MSTTTVHAARRGPLPKPRPFRLEPLVGLLCSDHGETLTLRRVAALLDLRYGTLFHYLNDGLTVWHADRLATRAGWHPSEVWGPAWFDIDIDVDALACSIHRHPTSILTAAVASDLPPAS